MDRTLKKIIYLLSSIALILFVTSCRGDAVPTRGDMLLTPEVKELLEKYPDFKKIVRQKSIPLDIEGSLIPQGITIMKNYIVISFYDDNRDNFSMCYILDAFGEIKNKVTLDTKSHVGGIAYDKINDLFWLPSEDAGLYAYDAKEFLSEGAVRHKFEFPNIGDGLIHYDNKNKNQIAYLTLDKNHIYVGSFSRHDKGLVKKFEILTDGENISLELIQKFKVPKEVQGISFYGDGKEAYILLSCSFGRKNHSHIRIYKYDEKIRDYDSKNIKTLSYEFPPLLEQIALNGKSVYALFESGAEKYRDSVDPIHSIVILDVEQIIDRNYFKE